MPIGKFSIEPFEVKTASEDHWHRYFALDEAIFREIAPDPNDPPQARAMARAFMVEPGPYRHVERWIALPAQGAAKGEHFIGFGSVSFYTPQAPDYAENKHIAFAEVKVGEPYRGQGVAQALLRTLLEAAVKQGATTIQGQAAHPAGHALCKHLGGTMAIEEAENRLKLAEVDWSMIQSWKAEGPARAPEVRIQSFTEAPEADLGAYTQVYTAVMNQQPMGKIENQMVITPQSRRVQEQELKKKRIEWYTMISREPDGAISGLTEMYYSPDEPHRIFQGLTGVAERYRGRGLGKWLKAEMLLDVRKRYPNLKFVATGNADVNAPMLSINRRMGFKRYIGFSMYKFKVNELCHRLGLRP